MLPGQLLPGQMSPWQLSSVKDCPRNLLLKFGQNQVSNSWDIPDMDKCCQDKCCKDKCCLDKCYCDSWNQFKIVPRTYVLSYVKIGSVTAEIFLIWTNVARTNVAWSNVTAIVEIFQDSPKNLHLKFCQNQVSNSGDFPNMDKCCRDECCLDKCYWDSCNLFKIVPRTCL